MGGAEEEPTLEPDDSTSAFVKSIMPLFLPTLRKSLSEKLINYGCILFNEEIVKEFDEYQDEDRLPIGKIEIKMEHVFVMDRKTVKNDMLAAPDFAWPESDLFDDLMATVPGLGRKMTVFDLVGFDCLLPLGKEIEIAFPAELPVFKKVDVEVGSGGNIERAWIRFEVPRLRLWFVNSTKKLYVAFMARPKLCPNFHVNLDKGNGDFLNISLTEEGNLDDVVEQVLCGFGPKHFTQSKEPEEAGRQGAQIPPNMFGNAIGKKISSVILNKMGRNGKTNIPLEIDLSETIKSKIDAAVGNTRSIDLIKADIEKLQEELDRAQALQKIEVSPYSSTSITTEEVNETASHTAFCGFGVDQ